MDVERDAKKYLNSELLGHLRLYLDQPNRPSTEKTYINFLTYFCFGLFAPEEIEQREIWSVLSLRKKLDDETVRNWPETYLELATKMVIFELLDKRLLVSPDGFDLIGSLKLDTKFKLRSGKEAYSKFYRAFAFAGEIAHIDKSETDALYEEAEKNVA